MEKARLADIGLLEAAKRLIPITVVAGRVANTIQDVLIEGRVKNTLSKEDEVGANKQALTDADLVCSNLVGAAALTQFSDVSYLSEESKADNVSKYFLQDQPHVLVFDPINGTSYLKDGKRCYENIFTIADAEGGNVLNTRRAVVVNMPRQHTVYVGDGEQTLVADTKEIAFDGRGELQYAPYRVPTTSEGGVYVSVSLADRLEEIRARLPNSRVAHHAYKEHGIDDPDWDFVPAGILDGRLTAFAIADIDLMDSLAIAYLARGAGAHVLIQGYSSATHHAALTIVSIDEPVFRQLCSILAT